MLRILRGAIAVAILGAPVATAEEKVDYEKQIQPIFMQHCAGCHGEKKASAKLRLNTAAGLKEKWDADKDLIVAGDPEKSELYQRLVLPADDKKRMPMKADPLPKETIDLIARWIKEGATLAVAAATPAPTAEEAKPQAEGGTGKAAEKAAAVPPPEVAAAPQEAIDALTGAGAQVMPLFGGSNLLTVSFANRSEPATDAEVALLAPIAEQVYVLNLADGKFTDAGLAPLAGLKNLAKLHLERSAVTDAGLAHVAGLANLDYLNVYGTAVTDEGLKQLAALKHLEALYLWQTKVTYDAAMKMEQDIPGLQVNLGYDHPVVVRKRLEKELEELKKQAEAAKAEQTKAEQQLEAAKKNAEATGARLAEVEKQIKELDAPPEAAPAAAAAAPAPEAEAAAEKPKEEPKPAEAPPAAN